MYIHGDYYHYDARDNITRIRSYRPWKAMFDRHLYYDQLDRLTHVDHKTTPSYNHTTYADIESFAYDKRGNITSKTVDKDYYNLSRRNSVNYTYHYNSTNHLTRISQPISPFWSMSKYHYGFNNKGSLSYQRNAEGKSFYYFYDDYDNLTTVIDMTQTAAPSLSSVASGTTTSTTKANASFLYDANNRLSQAIVGGKTQYFSYLGEENLVKYNETDKTLTEYYYLKGLPFIERVLTNYSASSLN